MRDGTERPAPLDLERDLPTTREDVEALRRAREESGRLTPEEFEALLEAAGHAPVEELRKRRGPRGAPFEL